MAEQREGGRQPPSGCLVLLLLAGDGCAELCSPEVRARREARNRRSQGEREPREVGGPEGWVYSLSVMNEGRA